MSQPNEASGTITPLRGSYKIGLSVAVAGPPIVKPVQKCVVAKWIVQCVGNEKDYYRLYVSDGQKDYGLRASEDGTIINAFEASPSSLNSHVWLIPHLADGFFGILDPATIRAWKVNGTAIELVEPPVADDGLESFKFKFSFY